MSSGNVISDNRSNAYTVCSGSGAPQGFYYSKQWSGENQIPGEPLTDHPYGMTLYESYTHTYRWLHSINSWMRQNGYPEDYYGWKTGDTLNCFGQILSPFPSFNWDNNDELKLINKVANRVRGSGFNAGNFLGESHQAINLISTTATRIAKALHYVRDGNFYAATRILNVKRARGHVLQQRYKGKKIRTIGEMSDAWLELQYGWKPLLSDVHESMETLAQRLEVPWKTSYRARRRIMGEVTTPADNLQLIWKREYKKDVHLIVHFASPPSLSTQLHLNDPIGVAWEIAPWSFVVDWFLPIQDYLNAIDFMRRFEIIKIVRSDKTFRKHTLVGGNPNLDQPDTLENPEDWHKWVTFQRSIVPLDNYFWMPTPQLKNMKEALSPIHLANAFALLTSTADGIRKSLKF